MAFVELMESWIPIILMITAISFIFYDWVGWRWLEHWIIGTGAGVIVATNWRALYRTGINPLIGGDMLLILPIIFGICLYFRFIPEYRWVARYGFLWVIAGGAGVTIGGIMQGQILPQIIQSAKIIGPTSWDTFNGLVSAIIFLTTLTYFIFTKPHKGVLGTSARAGRLFMMVGFGLGFSTLIQTYFAVILERVQWMTFKILGI